MRTRYFLILIFCFVSFLARGEGKDFYYQLAGHYAPIIYQDTWFSPECDYLTRFDADGDWVGNNNLDNHKLGKFKPYSAYVYYTLIESKTHYFIIYGFFHPVDYDSYIRRIIPGTTHENDMEGMMVVVRKNSQDGFGTVELFETWAHNWWNMYVVSDGVKPKNVRSYEKAELEGGTKPRIYIQQGGHGPYELYSSKSAYRRNNDFKGKTGVIYRFKGVAESPEGPNDRDVGYELIDFREPGGVWDHRCDLMTFDSKFFRYHPPQGRKGLKPNPDGCFFENNTLPRTFDGDLSGLANRVDAANCFWGWGHRDTNTGKSVMVWAFDPAWAINWQFEFSEEFSLDYVYNPYLEE